MRRDSGKCKSVLAAVDFPVPAVPTSRRYLLARRGKVPLYLPSLSSPNVLVSTYLRNYASPGRPEELRVRLFPVRVCRLGTLPLPYPPHVYLLVDSTFKASLICRRPTTVPLLVFFSPCPYLFSS